MEVQSRISLMKIFNGLRRLKGYMLASVNTVGVLVCLNLKLVTNYCVNLVFYCCFFNIFKVASLVHNRLSCNETNACAAS